MAEQPGDVAVRPLTDKEIQDGFNVDTFVGERPTAATPRPAMIENGQNVQENSTAASNGFLKKATEIALVSADGAVIGAANGIIGAGILSGNK